MRYSTAIAFSSLEPTYQGLKRQFKSITTWEAVMFGAYLSGIETCSQMSTGVEWRESLEPTYQGLKLALQCKIGQAHLVWSLPIRPDFDKLRRVLEGSIP